MNIEYDSCGRMKYNPDFHFNHKKAYTVNELAYICSTYRLGTRKQISLATGRTEGTIANLVKDLKKSGEFEHYKKLGETLS